MILRLRRTYLVTCTVGLLEFEDSSFDILEKPWARNAPNVSCIREGLYNLDRDPIDFDGERHGYYALRNSETTPRTAIELHPANSADDLLGCLAAGDLVWNVSGELPWPQLVNSRAACDALLELLGDETHTLSIEAWRPKGMNP